MDYYWVCPDGHVTPRGCIGGFCGEMSRSSAKGTTLTLWACGLVVDLADPEVVAAYQLGGNDAVKELLKHDGRRR